jgi:hypothetical protein
MSEAAGRYITIRAPRELREAIKEYAQRKGLTVTQLTLNYYRTLLAAEGKQEADQV